MCNTAQLRMANKMIGFYSGKLATPVAGPQRANPAPAASRYKLIVPVTAVLLVPSSTAISGI